MRESLSYMLDTNICIYLIKDSSQSLLQKIRSMSPMNICISSITLSELCFGVEKSLHREKNLAALNKLLTTLEVIHFTEEAAVEYGKIRADLERKGQGIGPLDTLIAAHALSKKLILVTNNTKEFKGIKNIHLENWT